MTNQFRTPWLCVLGVIAACGSQDGAASSLVSPASPQTPPPTSASLAVGGSAPLTAGTTLTLAAGATGGEFALVVTDTALNGSTALSSFTVTTTNTLSPGAVSLPAASKLPLEPTETPDYSYSVRLNQRAQAELASRVAGARALHANLLRRSDVAIQAAVQVGDLLSLNTSNSACDNLLPRVARVVAIGSTSIVVADTLDPAGGFSPADYQRFATRFDTLVYPIDVANFGAPAALGPEGKILLFFTTAVNALTPRNSSSFVGGFFFQRDQFPVVGTPDLQGCAGSNARNIFYLLTPDPTGSVNGNVRRTGFVDSITTAILAHEFQHLINSSRRLYVNAATASSEVVWLNEGLSHIAEELLFYHEGKSGPRVNLDVDALRGSVALKDAFNADESSNAGRYGEYLASPSTNSPIRLDDSLATRGATWDLLRYLADRKARAGATDAATWFALVNSKTSGVANLRAVFGSNVGEMLRDWSVSHYTDDNVSGVSADLTQPSWNWHSIFPALGSTSTGYPLSTTSLTNGATGTVIPGGAKFYRFAVAANASATLAIAAPSGVVHGTVVRVR